MLQLIGKDALEELNSQVSYMTVKSGRKVAFYQYGDPKGTPVLFCHGTGSHVHVMLLHEAAKEMGYRIIVPDRPGVGLSEPQPRRTLLDGARDLAELADYLGIKRFGVMGISGGGPTVLAAAYLLPDRLDYAVDLAGAVPLYTDPEALKRLGTVDRISAKLGARLPLWLFKLPFYILGFQQKVIKSPESFSKMMSSSMCKADSEIFSLPEMQYLFMRDFQELFRQGAAWPALDAQLIYLPWGFDVRRISMRLYIRQGDQDKWIPPFFSEYLAKTVPGASLTLIPGQGHFYHVAYARDTLKAVDEIRKK